MIVNFNTEKKFKNRLEKDVNLANYSWFNLIDIRFLATVATITTIAVPQRFIIQLRS